MTTARLFAAIDISDEARARVASYIDMLRSEFMGLRIGWEKPGKLHITMKFFGDVAEPQIKELQKTLDRVAAKYSSFTAELCESGAFPNARKPRILWIGMRNDGSLMAKLGNDIELASRSLGFPAEKRGFSPHLTIARVREPEKSQKLAEVYLRSGFGPLRFCVDEIVLYQSKLLPSGSVYSRVSRHAFGIPPSVGGEQGRAS